MQQKESSQKIPPENIAENFTACSIKTIPPENIAENFTACSMSKTIPPENIAENFTASMSKTTLDSAIQTAAVQANEAFKVMEIDARIMGPADPNWARVKVVDELFFANEEAGLLVGADGRVVGADEIMGAMWFHSKGINDLGPAFLEECCRLVGREFGARYEHEAIVVVAMIGLQRPDI